MMELQLSDVQMQWAMVCAAYLVGSLSFAVIVSRLMGLQDPRSYGSQNPGATNVLRSGNKLAAVLTLLLDAAKGWLPVFVVQRWWMSDTDDLWLIAAVAVAAFVGHVWPLFFRFQGGKGVATAAGALLGLNPWLGLATAFTWLAVAYVFRFSSLAALAAAFMAPIYCILALYIWGWGAPVVAGVVSLMSIVLIARHKDNLSRLLTGQETRIGGSK